MRGSRYLPFVLLGFILLIWGYLWVPGKLGVADSSAFVWAALRTCPAYVLLFCLLPVFGRPLRPKAPGLTALVGVLQVGGFVGLSSAALVTSGAGHTGMLANTWQFFILVMAWTVLGERLWGSEWLAVGIGLLGIVLIIEPWRLHGLLSSLLALAAALCFGAGAVAAKVLRGRTPVDLLSFTAWQGLLGSLPLAVLAALMPGDGIAWSGSFLWSLGYAVLIGTALGQLLWLHVLNQIPANIAGLGNLATPIVAVLAARIQLGERLSPAEMAGMGLVVLALGVIAARRLKPPSPAGADHVVESPGGADDD